MTEKIARPPTVWGSQLILFIFGAIWGIATLWNLYFALTQSRDPVEFFRFILHGIAFTACSAVALIGLVGLARRKAYGRAIGVLLFSSVMILTSLGGNIFSALEPLKYYDEYNNNPQTTVGFLMSIVFYVLLGLIIYGLAFGKQTTAFFSDNDPAKQSEPPPPPIFEDRL